LNRKTRFVCLRGSFWTADSSVAGEKPNVDPEAGLLYEEIYTWVKLNAFSHA